jgi:GTP cyclohydrolase I
LVVYEYIRRMTNGRADLDSPGLLGTPARVRKSWKELFPAYWGTVPAESVLTFFPEPGAAGTSVEIMDIPVLAVCEHHLLPFQGSAMVRYTLAGDEALGLSKVPRLVELYARRLTTQERITNDVLTALKMTGKFLAVEVGLTCGHDCMACRGAKADAETKTLKSWHKARDILGGVG